MTTQKEFNLQLATMSRVALAVLLPAIGLKPQHEKILRLWYVDCLGKWDIAEEMNLSLGSVYNLVSEARQCMKYILETQYQCLSDELRTHIYYLIEAHRK